MTRAVRTDDDISALSPRYTRYTLLIAAVTVDMNGALLPDILDCYPCVLTDSVMALDRLRSFYSLYFEYGIVC